MARYFIANSSIFDSPPYYQAKKIAEIVKEAIRSHNSLVGLGSSSGNVRLSNYHGWSNQPKVVCFDAPTNAAAEIIAWTVAHELGKKYPRFKTWGVIAQKKFW